MHCVSECGPGPCIYICIVFQYLISVLVLAMLIPRSSWHVKWIASAGLAQVSEFSFVLSSRARRLGLVSREVRRNTGCGGGGHTRLHLGPCL